MLLKTADQCSFIYLEVPGGKMECISCCVHKNEGVGHSKLLEPFDEIRHL